MKDQTPAKLACPLGLLLLAGLLWPVDAAGQTSKASDSLQVKEVADPPGWQVYEGDELIAGYRSDSGGKPIIYPLLGPAGHAMTRNFPMTDAGPGEHGDHDHHRSMWLTHGNVNGTDFWLDDKGCGKIVQTDGEAKIDDGRVIILTKNDWLDSEGKRILSDTRRITIFDAEKRRIVDCDFLLKATDGDVNFGDTKEGTFGIRVAGTMKVDAKTGGKITNAEGQHNKEAWGKKSPWVDYTGPVDGDTVGVTIHDHPSSFGYPCRWHVRTYGLFAANPFGFHHFTGEGKTNGVVLKEGKQMRLNYRVVLHEGELDVEQAEADAEKYANDPRPEME